MWQTIKQHKWAVLVAICLGALVWLPGWLKVYSFDNWQGVYPQINDDEVYYHARAQEVFDGYYFLTNPYLYEYKQGSPMQFWLPDFLLAKPLAMIGVDHWVGYRWYDLFLPMISFLFAYAIFYAISKRPGLSLAASIWLFFGMFLYLFNRGPSPQFSFIFWLSLALALFLYAKRGKAIYLAGVVLSLGLLFNLYPYYWTFYLVLLVLFVMGELWLKIKQDGFGVSQLVRRWLVVVGLSVVGGIPYFLGLWRSLQLPFYDESLRRLGMVATRFPSAVKITIPGIILVGIFVWLWRRRHLQVNRLNWLLFSGTAAAVIVTNQHLITGENLEFSSHYYLGSMFWFAFVVVYLLKVVYDNQSISLPKWSRVAVVIVGSYLVLFNIYSTLSAQLVWRPDEINWQRYGKVISWLKQNTEPDQVVFANDQLSSLIPAYTSNNVFYAREANLFFMPNAEVWERFILNHFWDNLLDDSFIKQHERPIWGTYYINRYGHKAKWQRIGQRLGLQVEPIERLPQIEIDKFKQLAQTVQSKQFIDQVKKYKLDYIVWDSYKQPHWQVKHLPVKLVWQSDGIFVYRFLLAQ